MERQVLIALLFFACGGTTKPRTMEKDLDVPAGSATKRVVEIHGHRGARGLFPENTIEGHVAALSMVDVLETDLLLTKDGQVVLHHDVDLNPDTTRDASGKWLDERGPAVLELTYAELQAYDVGRIKPGTAYAERFSTQEGRDGVRVPTLADAIVAVDKAAGERKARWNVEIKIDEEKPERTAPIDAAVDAVLAVLRERGAIDRTMIQSFDWRVLERLRAVAASVPTACLSEPKTKSGDVPAQAAQVGCKVWEPSFETLTALEVDEAHRLGMQVVPWTVNEPGDIRRVVALGVDGLISDYPDRVGRELGRPAR